jgi:hypothetical protein
MRPGAGLDEFADAMEAGQLETGAAIDGPARRP